MALQGEIMKYVGNELMNVGSKGLAKAGGSALSSLIPKVATKAVTPVATDVATKSVLGSVLPANDTIDLFRGQLKGNDNFYYNKGDGTKGSATVGNGLYMTPNEAKTAPWRGEGIEPIKITANKADLLTKDELVSKTKWANDILNDNNAMMEMWQKDPQQAELVEALSLGHLPEVSKYLDKPFIQPDSGQGEELAETIFFPDTRPELTEQYRKDLYNRANNITPAVPKTTNNLGYSVNEFGRLTDKSGKPVTFYHSTPAEFSEFDDAMLGRNTEAPNTAFGHFVTTDKDFSSRFKDINNEGLNGRTMELQARVSNPITHPYMAGQKYTDPAQLDKIVEDYLKATGNEETIDMLRDYAAENGTSLYDEYMDLTFADDPFEFAGDERQALLDNGYDAVEIIEGPKSGLVEGSTDDTPVSSLAVLEGKNLRQNRNIPVSKADAIGVNIDIRRGAGDVQRLIDADRSLSRLQNSPARGMLGNEQIQAYKRALNGENLSDEFLKNDKFARVLDEEVSKRPLLITPEQEDDPSLIDPKMLSEFEGTARKFINQNLDGVERGRKAVIVLGRPSSGKSSGAVNLYTNKRGGGFFELDNDEIKKLLPGYDDGMGANAVHNASSLISKKMVLPELADNGYNIVLPIVGKKESSVMSYVDELANRGYEIAMVNTSLPVEKCRTRNRTRAYETGRNVADAYLVSVGEKPDLVYNSIKEKIKNGTERRIGSYAEVSTDVPFGEKAILVENSGGELLARLSD